MGKGRASEEGFSYARRREGARGAPPSLLTHVLVLLVLLARLPTPLGASKASVSVSVRIVDGTAEDIVDTVARPPRFPPPWGTAGAVGGSGSGGGGALPPRPGGRIAGNLVHVDGPNGGLGPGLFLFAGRGPAHDGVGLWYLSDLWHRADATGRWTWIRGGDIAMYRAEYENRSVFEWRRLVDLNHKLMLPTMNVSKLLEKPHAAAYEATGPMARAFAGLGVGPGGKELYVWGGGPRFESNQVHRGWAQPWPELWRLRLADFSWSIVDARDTLCEHFGNVDLTAVKPSAKYGCAADTRFHMAGRIGASFFALPEEGRLLVYGGMVLWPWKDFLGDIVEFAFADRTWRYVWQGARPNSPAVMDGPAAEPAARMKAQTARDAAGRLWVFGGIGIASAGSGMGEILGDLWVFAEDRAGSGARRGTWTYLGGPTSRTRGRAEREDWPGSRDSGILTVGPCPNTLVLFGGHGYAHSSRTPEILGDVWLLRVSGGARGAAQLEPRWEKLADADRRPTAPKLPPLFASPWTEVRRRGGGGGGVGSKKTLWVYGGGGIDSNDDLRMHDNLWAVELKCTA